METTPLGASVGARPPHTHHEPTPAHGLDEAVQNARSPSSSAAPAPIDPRLPSPRLPSELIAYIIELVFLSSSPTPPLTKPSDNGSSLSSALPARTAWDARTDLLLVNRLFYQLARPHLFHTVILDSDRAVDGYFAHLLLDGAQGEDRFASLDRVWFGNVTAAERRGLTIDPIQYRLREAAWFEETAGGFIVGHAYATRPRPARRKGGSSKRPKALRRVSVYWAEEEILEEVSDPSSCEESDKDLDGVKHGALRRQNPTGSGHGLLGAEEEGLGPYEARDDEEQPAWQALYAGSRRARSARHHAPRPEFVGPRRRVAMSATLSGPVEGELDPWDMVAAQERLSSQDAPSDAAAAASSLNRGVADRDREPSLVPADIYGPTLAESTPPPPLAASSAPAVKSTATLVGRLAEVRASRRRERYPREEPREIYAYHLVTATLENWINRMLAEIKTLRYITITFYPGIILDDDKLEHVLRRMLSAEENPKLEQLLVRIAHEPTAVGSRFRRLDRAMTIGGAVDRIGDERIRIEGLSPAVGSGLLSPSKEQAATLRTSSGGGGGPSEPPQTGRSTSPAGAAIAPAPAVAASAAPEPHASQEGRLNAASHRAALITKDGWTTRVLEQNRISLGEGCSSSSDPTGPNGQAWTGAQRFSSILGHEAAQALLAVLTQADPFPDDPIPVEAPSAGTSTAEASGLLQHGDEAAFDPRFERTGYRQRQYAYINGGEMRERADINEPIEE
ncbi:hypothetical protein ACQY0O_006386 [Thecaphora frezii]